MGMGKRRRRRRRRCTVGLDWIFNPMGMGKKRCANLFNPMVMGMGMGMGKKKKKRCGSSIFNPMGMERKKRFGLLLLPEDVLISILVCLPVTSLLRFKSVCKSWLQLIETPFFIDLHTTTTTTFFNPSSSSSSKFDTFIIQTMDRRYKDDTKIQLYKLSSCDGEDDDDDDDDDDQNKMVLKVDDLWILPFYKDYLLEDTLRMVGSCNGIICLHDPHVMDIDRGCIRQLYSHLRNVYLWNPATRHFRILPKSIPKQYYIRKGYLGDEDFIAFGFDVKTKDYKVLRITPWDRLREGGVQVYSLSTDSWRLLEGINSLPGQVGYVNHGIYMNGSCFFVGRKGNTDEMMLLSFDFTKEIFTTIQLPENYSRYNNHNHKYYYDIWVLNEQHGSGLGVLHKDSRTTLHPNLLFRMKNELMKGRIEGKPTCISNNGEFALISTWENNKLQLFNLVTKEPEKDFSNVGEPMRRADVYKESLVSIMGGGNVLLRWQLPTHGTTYKLNLDAPFIGPFRHFGIGLCLISDTGGCIGVRSLQTLRYVRDAEEGEATAMLEAIKWAKELELSPIIIESDSKNVVSFFMDDDDDDDNNSTYWSSEEALSLLREAKLLLNSSELGISFQYCSRSCNYVADIAAKLGRERLDWTCMDWTAKFPGEMVRSLSKDFASKTW